MVRTFSALALMSCGAMGAQSTAGQSTTPAAQVQEITAPVTAPRFPRIFLQSASKGNTWSSVRDQSSEMARDFDRNCPSVKITINQARADYTVTLNHVEAGAFVRDNQFELYDSEGDRMKGKEGGSINKGVKGVCALIAKDWASKTLQSEISVKSQVKNLDTDWVGSEISWDVILDGKFLEAVGFPANRDEDFVRHAESQKHLNHAIEVHRTNLSQEAGK